MGKEVKLLRGSVAHKDYTGKLVVVHAVQEGESLSRIAAMYGFTDWRPIWTYNTKVEKTLGDDPALVRKGTSILIPRRSAGYDLLIRKLEACKSELAAGVDAMRYQLEGLSNEREAYKTAMDALGDGLTVVIGFGVAAVRAAKAASAARAAVGQAKIASKLSARAETKAWAETYARHRSRLTTKAIAANKDAVAKRIARTDMVKDAATDTAVELLDRARNAQSGTDAQDAKHLKNVRALDDVRKGLGKGELSVGQGALDALGVALDYLSVSAACEGWIWSTTGAFWGGETFDGTKDTLLANAAASAAAMSSRLDARIAELEDEKRLLYG